MRWLVADSLYCPEAFFCSHLDSYSHYLREAGEDAGSIALNYPAQIGTLREGDSTTCNVLLALDGYERLRDVPAKRKIAQVAALTNVMPWDVRKADGSPTYDCVISSIPWMVDAARAAGCRGEYMPLAFDTRARACGMGVARDLGCIFIGTTGPNHRRRAALLEELKDIVTVMPPVFGREYFKTLARATVVFSPHAEWARGVKNNMRLFEAAGMGAMVVTDGREPHGIELPGNYLDAFGDSAMGHRLAIDTALRASADDKTIAMMTELALREHTYESRIPRLLEIARSL